MGKSTPEQEKEASIKAVKEAIEMLHTLPADTHSALRPPLSTSPHAREFSPIPAQAEDLDFEANIVRLLRREFQDAPRMLLEQLAATVADRRRRILYEIRHQKKGTDTSGTRLDESDDVACPFCSVPPDSYISIDRQ